MKRKGQAALEFLITYGWAIVIIVGIVASLFFMGIQNPERYVSSRCLFEDSFSCDDFGFTAGTGGAGRVVLQLDNLVGLPLEITAVDVTVDGDTECDFSRARAGNSSSNANKDIGPLAADVYPVGASESFFLELSCTGSFDLNSDSTVALDVDVKYKILKEGYFPKTASGKVVGRT